MTKQQLSDALDAIAAAIEYFDDRADVDDGQPNTEMKLTRDLDETRRPLMAAYHAMRDA